MVKKKYKSKRLTLHKKYKIARKVREHKRKERKKEKLNQHKKKKDPGIPNNWPFKEELLLQVEQARLAELESARQAREKRKAEKKEQKQLAKQQRNALSQMSAVTPMSVEMQAKKDLKDTVQAADLALIVLDARDPQGSRSLSLEDGLIGKGGKKVVLVLNKVDLVPVETAQKWINYLRRFHPTIAVRSLNQRVKDVKVKTKALKEQKALYDRAQELSDLRDNGQVQSLRHFLDEYSKHVGENTTVAVLGYPNVGKSTLINSLKKRLVSPVSCQPHTTKHAVPVQYNSKLTLVDLPPLDPDYSDPSSVILRHGVAEVFHEDPVGSIKDLLERADATNLLQHLQIPVFRDHEDFLKKLAMKQNLRRRGGDPDVLLMARTFLRNLGNGVYDTTCLPPAKSKARFEMPEWYQKLHLTKMQQHETELFASNPSNLKRLLVFKASSSAHEAGDTTEYDLIMGELPECDGLTSSDEGEDDDDMDGDEEEEEIDDQEMDDEDDM